MYFAIQSSSPRRRGPIRCIISMWHDRRQTDMSGSMGPRLRGDDASTVLAAIIGIALVGLCAIPTSAAEKPNSTGWPFST